MTLKKTRSSDISTNWAITTVIGLICLRIALYCFKPEEIVSGRTMAQLDNEQARSSRITLLRDEEEQLQREYKFDRRVEQLEQTHDLNDWDDETMFLRFEHGNNNQGRAGFYAMKQGDRYIHKNTEDQNYERVLYDGPVLYYGDDVHDIDQGIVSPNLKYILFLTHEKESGCGRYWLWHVESKELRSLGTERLCGPYWSDHSMAILFSRVEISPTDAYVYHTERDQLVHQHNVVRPHAVTVF